MQSTECLSDTAYRLSAMLRTVWLAADNDSRGLPIEHTGIILTLEHCADVAGELLEGIERLEMQARGQSKPTPIPTGDHT